MNERAQAVDALEHRLGHAFKNLELLERALTHASVGGGARRVRDNEVLEFVGDRVIGLLAAERLAELYPKGPEGELSVRLHRLVNREACARVGRRMGLSAALRLSAGESKTGGRENDTILGDACEAVMAAVHLDGGLEAARQVFLDLWSEELAETAVSSSRDPKTTLQEWAQGHGRALPVYTVTRRSGPDHAPVFTVEVAVDGLPAATADGRSRKEAEKAAAAALLEREAGA